MTPLVYLPTLERLGLALAIGLFVGLEREHRRKEAGLRTFGCASLIGALGAMLGENYALASLGFLALIVLLLNVQSLRANQGLELTTSAALFVTGLCGILCGGGHTMTPAALAVVTAALLAWKEPMAGFSKALTDAELRSAIALAILALVVYPALPAGPIDRWALVEPRAAWLTVLLIAGIGFANYVLLKLYGARGVEVTGFLGGIVNSTVTVTELARRDRESQGALESTTRRGVLLATAAMILRNAVLLAVLSPSAFSAGATPLVAMAAVGVACAAWRRRSAIPAAPPALPLESPFSVTSALRYGALFLVLQVGGSLAQRALGEVGFYAVSLIGGMLSSASAVASAGAVAAHGDVSAHVAGTGAVLATLVSAAVNWPLAARISQDRALGRRLVGPIAAVIAVGFAGVVVQTLASP
ncbi:MAG TPA: MgtC/SapB family protein [Kofleriaceae bacterium]